jgi:predicted alpha/beta hydrolase family esterase
MKRAVILHGMDGHAHAHWFPWLKAQLQKRGYQVWVPNLPKADQPDAKRWTSYLLSHGWDFNDNLVIGHSAGAVEILQLAQALPDDVVIKTGVLCAAFNHTLPEASDWQVLKGLFQPALDFEVIGKHARQFVFFHAADDPWSPPAHAVSLAKKTGGELVMSPHGKHFSTTLDPEYKQFPRLIEILEARHLL